MAARHRAYQLGVRSSRQHSANRSMSQVIRSVASSGKAVRSKVIWIFTVSIEANVRTVTMSNEYGVILD